MKIHTTDAEIFGIDIYPKDILPARVVCAVMIPLESIGDIKVSDLNGIQKKKIAVTISDEETE